MMEAIFLRNVDTRYSFETSIQEPHGITYQKTPFFIVTAVKTSNLAYSINRLASVAEI
jgi:hypothetical protein